MKTHREAIGVEAPRYVHAVRQTPIESHDATTRTDGMVRVPGGQFTMGSDRHQPEKAPAHRPIWHRPGQHRPGRHRPGRHRPDRHRPLIPAG